MLKIFLNLFYLIIFDVMIFFNICGEKVSVVLGLRSKRIFFLNVEYKI